MKERAPRGLWLTPLIILIVDQLTKWIVMSSMVVGESIAWFGDWFRITYVRNPGGAFGTRWGHPAVFYVAGAAVTIWIVRQLWLYGHTRRLSIGALALILGGAVGNMIDRIAYGQVTDFIDVEFFDMTIPSFDFGVIHHPGYMMSRWPTFNIADSAVTVGIALLMISMFYDPQMFVSRSGNDTLPSETQTVTDDDASNSVGGNSIDASV